MLGSGQAWGRDGKWKRESGLRLQLGRPGSGETGLSFGPLGVGSPPLSLSRPACHSAWWPAAKRGTVSLPCSSKLALGMPGGSKRDRGLGPLSPPQEKFGREGTGQRIREREVASNQDGRRGQSHLEKSVEPTGRLWWDREGVGVRQGWVELALCRFPGGDYDVAKGGVRGAGAGAPSFGVLLGRWAETPLTHSAGPCSFSRRL